MNNVIQDVNLPQTSLRMELVLCKYIQEILNTSEPSLTLRKCQNLAKCQTLNLKQVTYYNHTQSSSL